MLRLVCEMAGLRSVHCRPFANVMALPMFLVVVFFSRVLQPEYLSPAGIGIHKGFSILETDYQVLASILTYIYCYNGNETLELRNILGIHSAVAFSGANQLMR